MVVIAVEIQNKGTGRIRLQIVASASAKDLSKFITTNIEIGSSIITDGWTGYSEVSGKGYSHQIQGVEGEDMMMNKCCQMLIEWHRC